MKEFNIVVTGIGGQGVLTLASIIAEAALRQGYDVKTSELHGLAQRGGTIPCHVRFGEKIYSPIVREGEANLVIGLEPLEALRACYYGSKENKTVFLIDTYRVIPISVSVVGERYPPLDEMKNILKNFSSEAIFLNASEIVKKETGSIVATNIYLLGYASRCLIPIKREFLFEGIREVVPEKYFEMNKKIFELGCKAVV
ncbi:MAG: indolepyruvate oxidoreductase subunit beta [Candidatus Aenigmarchaeota archaeon]|nr:indolepyruvate oxidoreductase subunit beta [Candidatus Aenigmarchaeota archaeon]